MPFIAIDAGGEETEPLQGAPRMLLCAEGTLAAQELGGPAVGFSAVPPLRAGGLLELTRGAGSSEATVAAAERFAADARAARRMGRATRRGSSSRGSWRRS